MGGRSVPLERPMTDQQISRYLERIGYQGGLERSRGTLDGLCRAHMIAVPYENLDLLYRIPLSLSPHDLFLKLVEKRRGGYCFELNGLFCWLLRSLGFPVTDLFGRFLFGYEGIPMRRHRVLKVLAEGETFLCDVGLFAEETRGALVLAEGREQTDGQWKYRLERDDFLGWVLWQKPGDGPWSDVYSFTEEPQLDIDFVSASFYCETHPDSIFHRIPKICKRTRAGGRVMISGDKLKIYDGLNLTSKQQITSREEFEELIQKYFTIDPGTFPQWRKERLSQY